MQTIGNKETMYRTPSGREIDLAETIRTYTSGPCWPREDGSKPLSEASADKSMPDRQTIAVQIAPK